MLDVAMRRQLAKPRVDLRLAVVVEAVGLCLRAIRDPILAGFAIEYQILHERDVQTSRIDRNVVEGDFAPPLFVADDRNVSAPIELDVPITVGLTRAVFVPVLARSNLAADHREHAALDGWVRRRELTKDAFGDRGR